MSDHFSPDVEQATAYCTYCPKLCRFSCPVAEAECRETVTPWGLMRLLEFTRTEDFEVDEHVAKTFYHCTGCARCQTWCNHRNDVPKAMWSARAWSVEQGHLPEVLGDIEANFDAVGAARIFAELEQERVDEIFDQKSSIAFFPDCHTRERHPELVLMAGKLLHELLGFKVRLLSRVGHEGAGCCGFELKAAGLASAYEAHGQELSKSWSGVKKIISDCAPFVAMRENPTRYLLDEDVVASWPKLEHIIETLAEFVDENPPQARLASGGVMLHDSCYVGRHLNLYDATRQVAAALFEQLPTSFHLDRDQASCCGAANHYDQINPTGAKACAQEILDQMQREGGEALLCGQANCKHAFGQITDDVAIDILEAACMAYEISL